MFNAAAALDRPAPEWLSDQRRAAVGRLGDLRLPTADEEVWRYSPIGKLDLGAFAPVADSASQDEPGIVGDVIWGPEITASPLYPDLRELLFTSMRGVALAYAFEERPATTDPHLRLWKRLAHQLLSPSLSAREQEPT